MLCRAILTAIAISYVICVLLLSGLQKEELDANTMEKLRRHNVNIYDMNNESLRQECLLKSLNAAKENERIEMNEDKNDTLTISLNKPSQNDEFNAEIPKSEIAAVDKYFGSREDLRSLIDEIKIKGVIHKEPIRSDNKKAGNTMPNTQDEMNGTIVHENKVPQMESIRSQPSLDSVLKFWSKFTRKPAQDTEDVISFTTTYIPPRMEEIIQSTANIDNKGYVHSREKEYINRIIAEYLASQKVSTTTQVIKKKRKNSDAISRKIQELLAEKAKEDDINPIIALKDMGDALNLRSLTELTDFSGPIRINNKDRTGTRKTQRKTSIDKKYDNDGSSKRLENEPYHQATNISPKTIVKNPAPGIEALKYLDAYLRLNKESKTSTESTPYTQRTTEEPIINIDEQEFHERWNKDIRYNVERANDTNRDLNQVHSKEVAKDQVVSVDVIQKIAEKVKEIVLKDIRKSTSEVPITITATAATTALLTATTTDAPAMSFKDTKNGKQMLETLMELFKEYKSIKETTSAPVTSTSKSDSPLRKIQPEDRLLPPVMGGLNPYEMKPQVANIRELGENAFKSSLIQIPLGPADRALQATSYNHQVNNFPKSEYRVLPITIQTNSVEIAPLAIPLPKPIPLINQHIIVTTPNPFARHREQQRHETDPPHPITGKYREVLSVGEERNHRAEVPTYSDLAKKLRAAEDVRKDFRDSYQDRITKLKERIKHAHEHNREKARELNQALGSDHRIGISRLMGPSYHGGLGSSIGSGHRDSMNQPLHLNNRDTYNRPISSSHREAFNRPLDPNLPETVNRALNLNLHDNLNNPLEPLHESLRPLDLNRHGNYDRPIESSHRESINRQMELNQYVPLGRAEDPNQRDIITREVLSRLVGSNHHDVISRLVEPSAHDVINRPVDLNQQSRSHHSDAYERIEHEQMHPRFKGARFHEELERIEDIPRNNYNNAKPSNCCDGVAARQQMPLTKIKQRGRFDDTHFRNFLKSQQKVTDMLERILASKAKQERPSVETS